MYHQQLIIFLKIDQDRPRQCRNYIKVLRIKKGQTALKMRTMVQVWRTWMENERGRGWNEERGWSYRSWRWIRWNDYEHFVDFQQFSGINLLNSTNSIYVCPMICTSAGHSLTKLFIGFWFECYIKGVFTQIFICITR